MTEALKMTSKQVEMLKDISPPSIVEELIELGKIAVIPDNEEKNND